MSFMERLIVKIIGICFLVTMLACSEVEGPTSLTPQLTVLEPSDVTRNSAWLSCEIEKLGMESVSTVQCRYGTSINMDERIICDPLLSKVAVLLSNLKSHTTYYYCFEVGNGCSTVRSSMNSFTTEPDQAPLVGDLQILGKGPTSIMLQFELEDDGGQDLLSAGFRLQAEGEEEEIVVIDSDNHTFYERLGDLKLQTKYSIQGFAINSIGESRTPKIHFETEQAVKLVKAGTLKELITEEERLNFSSLVVAGPMNGTDFRVLREMMGRDINGNPTGGRMNVLDLRDVTIVAGGESYDGSHYTERNVVGCGMFADCVFLENIQLPYGLVEIEKGAFDDCVELDSLCIPMDVSHVSSSIGCTQLKKIDVADKNQKYTSFDGCLYSNDCTTLYWYPEGKVQGEVSFPDNIKRIEAYAFQNARITDVEIPVTVEELGVGAFFATRLETVTIPEKVTFISTGLFQACSYLSSVWLGKSVTFLSAYCFDGCPLKHLYVPVKDFPPICTAETFAGAEHLFADCVLHVPVGCKKMYQNEKGWENFKHIQDDIED